jgi:hypothetical protein
MTALIGAFLLGCFITYLLMRSNIRAARKEAAESRYMHDRAMKELEIALGMTAAPRMNEARKPQ